MMSGKKTFLTKRAGQVSVWDSHVHCYPREVMADPAGWARKTGELHWGQLVTSGPQGWADVDELIAAMDRDGIEKVLLQSWYWEKSDTARRQNEWHAAWLDRYPDRLMACLTVHPELEEIEAVMQEGEDWGAVAIGECLPQVQTALGWQDPGWERIINGASERDWPCTLHVTEPVGHEYPGRVETSLMETLAVISTYPRQKWILAHWGGGLPFYSLNKRIRKALKSVWFDTAASPLLYDQRVWKCLVELIGSERILFGSDFPLLLYPAQQRIPGWERLLGEFLECGLAEEDLRAIARDNLRKLIGQDD